MPFLISDAERAPLRPGRNVLGGRGADAVVLTSLAGLQPAAVITVQSDGSAEIQRLSAGVVVKVDGEPLGATPHALRHGARVAIGAVRVMYADPTAERDGAGLNDPSEAATELVPAVPEAANSGRLIELATGRAFPVPPSGLAIGRGGGCDVVVDGTGISRRHAVVSPDGPGFRLTDESANGTYVNGTRIERVRVLGQGDVVRIGTHEFRLEVDAALAASDAPPLSATELVAGVSDAVPQGRRTRPDVANRAASADPPPPEARVLATLEVTSGPLGRKVFRVERAVCAIGRGEQNEIRLAHSSVSATHATLLHKRGTWYAVDLQSANGTYVDGYRVAGERRLADGGTLRVGDVAMRFRISATAGQQSNSTQPLGGLLRRLSKLWSA